MAWLGNVDHPVGSALQLPSPPGGEGNMAAGGLGVYPLSKRGGLLTTGVSSTVARSWLGLSANPTIKFRKLAKNSAIFLAFRSYAIKS